MEGVGPCASAGSRESSKVSPFPPFILPETPEARDKQDLHGLPPGGGSPAASRISRDSS